MHLLVSINLSSKSGSGMKLLHDLTSLLPTSSGVWLSTASCIRGSSHSLASSIRNYLLFTNVVTVSELEAFTCAPLSTWNASLLPAKHLILLQTSLTIKESHCSQCFTLGPLWCEGYNVSRNFQLYLLQTLKRLLHLKKNWSWIK